MAPELVDYCREKRSKGVAGFRYCDILGFHSNVTGLCNNENKRFHDARNNETDATMKQM
jgi:hypothetical protein